MKVRVRGRGRVRGSVRVWVRGMVVPRHRVVLHPPFTHLRYG